MKLGKAIKLCRQHKGMTLAALAEKSELSTAYISQLEQGKRDPSFSTVEKIASGLNIPLVVLIFLMDDKSGLESINPEIAEKLSLLVFKLLQKESAESKN